jgi:hypothetical protein
LAYALVVAHDDNLTVIIIHHVLAFPQHDTHLPCEVPELTLCNFVTVMLNVQAELANVMCSHTSITIEQGKAS